MSKLITYFFKKVITNLKIQGKWEFQKSTYLKQTNKKIHKSYKTLLKVPIFLWFLHNTLKKTYKKVYKKYILTF